MTRIAKLSLLTMLVTCLAAAGLAGAATRTKPGASTALTAGCQLGDKGKIKHVIYVQFDNVHFLRDNPNVPSDVEQMPNLLNFMKDNGSFLTNDHSILISHTGGGILSTLTGLYPDRHGQAVSNSYNFFRNDGSGTSGFSSTFKYWTDLTDGGNPANTPPTASTDPNYNMVNADSAALGGTGAVRNAPAPWVPYARAGCDVGNVGVANTVLENNNSIIFKTGSTSIFATDPTGDMTKVFGEGSTEWTDGKNSQLAASGTAARAKAQTDYVGVAIHCATVAASICTGNTDAKADPLPDEAPPNGGGTGGYTGFKALFGSKYVNPAITKDATHPSGTPYVNDTNGPGHPIEDPFHQPGFPGFDGMYAKSTLGIVAQMQEHGVPVTFAYISDAHDNHGNSGDKHIAYGPGEAGYVQQLKDYDKAFGDFFTRLKNDGITKDNTLFVFTVEEGDHFAGTAPDAPCDGVTTPCTYANGHVTEVNGDVKKMVATYNATHGTSATTNFSVHSDMAPNVYVNGNPARDSATARTLEKAMSDIQVKNPLSGEREDIFAAMADPVEEKLLHMVTADPARTPTFTPFAQGDYFLNASQSTPCTDNDLDNCVFLPSTAGGVNSFAWNHGGIQPEVATTWVGIAGPGVEKRQPGDDLWSDHTDIRPTMLELLGLKDSYVSDGRVLTEILKDDVLPKSLKQHHGIVDDLGAAYKQIMASFGQLSMDSLTASTAALASDTPGDTVYSDTEAKLAKLGEDRDALAGKIRLALWNAEFGGQAIDQRQAKGWVDDANDLLGRATALAASFASSSNENKLKKIKHIVVIYEENHSFDNLYGGWEGVNGLSNADVAHTTQVGQDAARTPYKCLKQNDLNLASPPLPADKCTIAADGFASHFTNTWFTIDDFLGPDDTTCPPTPLVAFSSSNGWLNGTGSAGGCTRDIVHRFYHEQYQLDGGRQDRYVTGSDAIGLVMGTYETRSLPIYQYLHDKGHPDYAIADNFFQSAFGGSFLNHQWLIAAASPLDPTGASGGAHATRHPTLDANGMPSSEPLYTSTITPPVPADQPLTATCAQVATLAPPLNGLACGNYGVNTMQPAYRPFSAFGVQIPAQTNPTIGDRLTDSGIDWAWYAGGWANANGEVNSPGFTNGDGTAATPTHCTDPYVDQGTTGTPPVPVSAWPRCPDNLFQYHHQPFNYYAAFTTETPAGLANRAAHLRDEVEFTQLAQSSQQECNLKPVSFVKPFGTENEHPGYASETQGGDHLVSLLKAIEGGKCGDDTMVIVTYDEFGGQWDHVPPPGQGNDNGPHDVWGPGTRIPALVLAPHLKGKFVVDSSEYDTTSILATIERRYGLDPLASRDAAVADLSNVFSAKKPEHVHE
jgi:phospholipase C